MLANQPRVPFAGDRAQTHGHLLHDEERHDQQELQQNQLVAELRTRGRCRRDAARFGIGKRDDQPRTGNGQKAQNQLPERTAGRSGRGRCSRVAMLVVRLA